MRSGNLLRALWLAVVLMLSTAGVALAAASKLPDLQVKTVSNPPTSMAGRFTVTYTVVNKGKAPAGETQTLFYLSSSRTLHSGDPQIGSQSLSALAAKGRASESVDLTVPATVKQGSYHLIACANGTHSIEESNTANNCRASTKPGNVPSYCPVTEAICVTSGVFVSASDGNDAAAGTRAQPFRTLAKAMEVATRSNENVYVTVGVYSEALNMANGISVYGGYATDWKPTSTEVSTPEVTQITGATDASSGDTEGAVATNISSPTTLERVTLTPSSPAQPGRSSYGLRGINAGGLRLVDVGVYAAAGTRGPSGRNGEPGYEGAGGTSGGQPGFGQQAGEPGVRTNRGAGGGVGGGGQGGLGGFCAEWGPSAGERGWPRQPDAFGHLGGPGGAWGASGPEHYSAGENGYPGEGGINGALIGPGNGSGGTSANASTLPGFWRTSSGTAGYRGEDGTSGGGGGGGGSSTHEFFGCENEGGGGGGGGQGGGGGGGGQGGQGGGGSFGIFLASSSGAEVSGSTVTSANGGQGGSGGAGAPGGTGGPIGFGGAPHNEGGRGGAGGPGGDGGNGADGGGGAGGPSVAIFGLTSTATPGTTVGHGSGGAGGAGGSGTGGGAPAGVSGAAENYM
jgi:hypothetical protein